MDEQTAAQLGHCFSPSLAGSLSSEPICLHGWFRTDAGLIWDSLSGGGGLVKLCGGGVALSCSAQTGGRIKKELYSLLWGVKRVIMVVVPFGSID